MNWLLLPTLAGYGLAIIGLVGWYVDSKDLKKTRVGYWNERDDKIKAQDALDKARAQYDVTAQAFTELDSLHQKATKERDILSRECRKSEDAIAFYVGELQKANAENKSLDEDNACMAEANAVIAIERDEWMRLYNELLTTYHDAQGDAHATMPLQEVAPAPVKRTRKKAETKQ